MENNRLIIASENINMGIRSVMGVFKYKPFSVYSVDSIHWRSDWNTLSDEEMHSLSELLFQKNKMEDKYREYVKK